MPTYVIRRSPDHEEYLLWSTVVDSPVSYTMDRGETLRMLIEDGHSASDAEARIARADARGTSCIVVDEMGYGETSVWWRECAPDDFGEPYEVEDEPGLFVGRVMSRDDMFRASRQAAAR